MPRPAPLSGASWLAPAALVVASALEGPCAPGFAAGGPAKKHELAEAAGSIGAKCLDGSPGAYYLQEGSGSGANKWYIHHEGGGWCTSMVDCFARSKTDLGSSKRYPATATLGGGYFSRNHAENPLMHNWNHVLMRYCDGASFSGNNETTETYRGTTLYWRGKRIREAIAKDLMANRGLGRATDLIVSGCSAGGLATFLHTDQWCDMLKSLRPGAKCAGLPDSGFFLDYQDPTVVCSPPSEATDLLGYTINGDYHCGLKWTFTVQNATDGINKDCVAAHRGAEWKCMFAEHSAEHLRSPVFAMQSAYDSWQTAHVQGRGGRAKTQVLGNNITARIQSTLLARNNESGAFLDSCLHHCGYWNSIRIDGYLVSAAIKSWYDGIGRAGSKKLWNQNRAFPCAACCRPGGASDVFLV